MLRECSRFNFLPLLKEDSANIPRADSPWMVPPTSNSPPPPWEPPANSWDAPPNNVSNTNPADQVWSLPSNTGECVLSCTHPAQLKISTTQICVWNFLLYSRKLAFWFITSTGVDPFSVSSENTPKKGAGKEPPPRSGSPSGKRFLLYQTFT